MPGPRRHRRTALALTAVLVGGAAVVGARALIAPPDAARVPTAATAPHALPPVTERLFSWTDVDYRSAEAQRRYAVACMAEHGFRYAPPAPPQPGMSTDQRPQPFGQESAAPSAETPPPAAKPPVPGSPETTKAYGLALFGDEKKRVSAKGSGRMKVSRPGNGCLAEAETKVLGDGRMRWLQVRIMLFEAQEEARGNLEKDPEFRALNGRWRACMNEAGFRDVTDPARLLASLRTADARRADASLAADLRCKESTGYLPTAYARLAVAQQRWLDRHPDVDRDGTALLRRQDEATRTIPVPKA
ncbi:hypothetical protein [Streptomyces sp. NBC_00572]|uniref:hypothetical protein n=1 Tax=Streptomyces sp. NBC_00572 TaxID=2903664 RepID=UPI00225B322C|nr:hypothetical protein [Streptomyces sp. NBC_00572]MCX4980611.1 hypothetical protein [Streptomyces sp. NBC_00572]